MNKACPGRKALVRCMVFAVLILSGGTNVTYFSRIIIVLLRSPKVVIKSITINSEGTVRALSFANGTPF